VALLQVRVLRRRAWQRGPAPRLPLEGRAERAHQLLRWFALGRALGSGALDCWWLEDWLSGRRAFAAGSSEFAAASGGCATAAAVGGVAAESEALTCKLERASDHSPKQTAAIAAAASNVAVTY
jgi:hypothetical protein